MHNRKQKSGLSDLGLMGEMAWLSSKGGGRPWDSFLPGMTPGICTGLYGQQNFVGRNLRFLTRAGALAFQPWIACRFDAVFPKSLFHANMWQSTFGGDSK
jgi:hypothetical protein